MSAEQRADEAVASLPPGLALQATLLQLTSMLGDAALSTLEDAEVPVRIRLETSTASPAGEVTAIRRRLIGGRPGIELFVAAPGLGGSMSQFDPRRPDPLEQIAPSVQAIIDAAFHRIQVLRHYAWRWSTWRRNGLEETLDGSDCEGRTGPSDDLGAALRRSMSADTFLGLVQDRCDPWSARLEQRCEVYARFRASSHHRVGQAARLGDNCPLGGIAYERISNFDLILAPPTGREEVDPFAASQEIVRMLGDLPRAKTPLGMVCRTWLELPRPASLCRLGSGPAWTTVGRTAWLGRGHRGTVRIAVDSTGGVSTSRRSVERIAGRRKSA